MKTHADSTKSQTGLPLTKKKTHRHLRLFIRTIVVLLAVIGIFIIYAVISPYPVSMITRIAFNHDVGVAPDNYDEIKSRVSVIQNIRYRSEYPDNYADLYIPVDQGGPFPVVLWIHGGAFVGGDKKDIKIYAEALAAEGIAVVCMNYRRAPEAKYPVPVVQTNEVYLWLMEVSDEYTLDLNRFVLAGDSAGAQIAAQFAAIQSNAVYAAGIGFPQSVPLHTLKAALLFCGPYDVAKIAEGNHWMLGFIMKKTAEAYFGKKDWAEYFSYQATISNHITKDFPPVFISDGNTLSLEDHGRDLAEVLKKNGVPVETYFIPVDDEVTKHEYQFEMKTAAGRGSFRATVNFLNQYLE